MKTYDEGKFKLYNGIDMPDLCYGPGIVLSGSTIRQEMSGIKFECSMIGKFIRNKNVVKSIEESYNIGYRCYDTSAAYRDSEVIIKTALEKYERESYFFTTKISNRQQLSRNVYRTFDLTMKKLEGLEYIDLYLIHWPRPGYLEIWKQMEDLYLDGKVRAIGVCNCQINHLDELMNIARVKPMVNQFEIHPLFIPAELCEYCNENDIQIMAYTPTARCDDRLINSIRLNQIARKYNKSVVQIILKWHIQRGRIPVVATSQLQHLKDNINIQDFEMKEWELLDIDEMNINSRLRYDSNACDFWNL